MKKLLVVVLNENDVFDNCFIVDEECGIDTRDKPLKQVFEASSFVTNNKLKISTTEPAFQFYTGDGVNTKGLGKDVVSAWNQVDLLMQSITKNGLIKSS